jgi:hypothetical protein
VEEQVLDNLAKPPTLQLLPLDPDQGDQRNRRKHLDHLFKTKFNLHSFNIYRSFCIFIGLFAITN